MRWTKIYITAPLWFSKETGALILKTFASNTYKMATLPTVMTISSVFGVPSYGSSPTAAFSECKSKSAPDFTSLNKALVIELVYRII